MKYAKIENGTVRVYATLPKTYENIINFQKADIETINSKGFYELVEPILTQYQRAETLLVSDLVGTQFIQRVYNFTQAEIDAHEKSKEDNDASAQKVSNFKANGQREHKRIWDRIMQLYDNGQLNDTQFNAISDLLFDALLPLELGLWKVAQARVDALPVGTGILATIRTTVKSIIDDYVIANY